MPKITDLLEQLFELKWRDVAMPCTDFGTDIEHDQVSHEWPDRDGAHVEATGRKPLVHHASIPFRSNLSPGLAETWNAGGAVLYPTVFRQFLIAFSTRTTGPLQHPELGIITCKPKACHIRWQAKRRDGCDVQATWIESLDDTVTEFQDILASKSPVPAAVVASIDLDAQLTTYHSGLLADPSFSFEDAIIAITTAFDAASLISSQAAGQINRVLYRLQRLQDRIQAAGDVTAWPITNSCLRLQDALNGMQARLLAGGKTVFYHRTQVDTTLPALVPVTNTSVTDLLTLNPRLAAYATVPALTVVRYYAPAI